LREEGRGLKRLGIEADGNRFMAASKVLGEETSAATAARERLQAQGQQRGNASEP
jgi:hypothetical protein